MAFINISDAERIIMRVLWSHGSLTSHEIISILTQTEDWQPTTIKTLINRLMKKNYIQRKKIGKKYSYSPMISEKETIQVELSQFFQPICARQKGTVLNDFIAHIPLSTTDIEMLERTLSAKKEQAPQQLACNCPPGQCRCKYH